jgi:hypothetical protein
VVELRLGYQDVLWAAVYYLEVCICFILAYRGYGKGIYPDRQEQCFVRGGRIGYASTIVIRLHESLTIDLLCGTIESLDGFPSKIESYYFEWQIIVNAHASMSQ